MYMTEAGGFVFYGMERLLAHLPPHKLASMNLVGACLSIVINNLFVYFLMCDICEIVVMKLLFLISARTIHANNARP